MRATVSYKSNGEKVYQLDGRTVDRQEYEAAVPHKLKDALKSRRIADGHRPNCWPMQSYSAGVNPDQIQEATEGARKAGVPTEFAKNGDAIFTSREHRKKYAKAMGWIDFSGTWGDA